MKKEKEKMLIDLYQNGVSISELSKEYLLHRTTLQLMFKRNNIPLHFKKTKFKCNKNFFNEYTNDSCYWAGFILADGNIAKNRNMLQICLAKIDGKHLENFLHSINSEELDKIKYYEKYVTLKLCVDEFKNDLLNNFDIGPQKTFSSFISDKIPKDKIKHFIRGYFDGDGSIIKSKYKSINFVGTVKVLNKIAYEIKEIGIILKSNNIIPPIQTLKNGVGHISYSGVNSKKILEWLYSDSTENIRLNRKFKRYCEIYKKNKNEIK